MIQRNDHIQTESVSNVSQHKNMAFNQLSNHDSKEPLETIRQTQTTAATNKQAASNTPTTAKPARHFCPDRASAEFET